jgi:DNA integrity scanning protein DisA with diadenylate cyclase activity
MVKKNTEEIQSEVLEVEEPITANELVVHLLEDLVTNADPADLATEFIDEFVLRGDRPETSAILAMLDAPSESLLETIKTIIEQGYQAQLQAVDERGYRFLEGLKAEVKAQMQKLAN